jgi:hypothetical protein
MCPKDIQPPSVPTVIETERDNNSRPPFATLVKKDLDSVESMQSLLDATLTKYLDETPKEWFDLEEKELDALVRPSHKDRAIRVNFWHEYEKKAFSFSNKIETPDFYRGMVSRQSFNWKLIHKPGYVLWLLHRPKNYDNHLRECLDFGLQRLRDDILTANLQYPNGHMDPKAAAVFMQALVFLDNRVRGPLAQRLEINSVSKTFNMNVSKKIEDPKDSKALDSKIKELREKLGMTKDAPKLQLSEDSYSGVIDVVPSETTDDRELLPIEVALDDK